MSVAFQKSIASVRDVFSLEKTPITSDSLDQIAKLTIITALASLFDIFVFFVGALGRLDIVALLIWSACAVILPLSSLKRPAPKKAPRAAKKISRRGFRKAIAYAAFFAAPWAALPLLFLGQDPITDILIVAVTAGMASAGAFMLFPIPAAAIVYFTLIEVAVIVACVFAGLADYGALAAFTAPYIVVLTIITLRSFRLARDRAEGLLNAELALDQLKKANKELDDLRGAAEREAVIDELTGLNNRRGLSREIVKRGAIASSTATAVLHLDLDRFKQINDTLGHAAGDQILRHAADLLRANTRASDFVARIGGDEFVILANFNGEQSAIVDLAERLIKAMRAPIRIEGEVCNFGVSIGIDIANGDPDLSAMLINADIALYRAKAGGRSRFHLFSPLLAEQVRREKSLGDDLLEAIAARSIDVVYQPQIQSKGGKLASVEALARWSHPTRGVLPPTEFLALAHRLGAAAQVDQIVLERVLDHQAQWRAERFAPPSVSVNICAERLADPNLPAQLAAQNLPKGRLSFEIGEETFLAALDDEMRLRIDQLTELGVGIELDGFGACNRSLAALTKYRPHRVKIAQDLVAEIERAPELAALLRALTEIARSHQIGVTAAGIETSKIATAAAAAGCDRLQGFHIAPPMSADMLMQRYGGKTAGQATATSLTA